MFEAAQRGDLPAVEERDRLAGYLAVAVTMIGLTVDPQVIVLGGGVADIGRPLLDAVGGDLRSRAGRSELLDDLALADRLSMVPDGMHAGAIGAVELVRSVVTVAPR